jgi:hypothetical protein
LFPLLATSVINTDGKFAVDIDDTSGNNNSSSSGGLPVANLTPV